MSKWEKFSFDDIIIDVTKEGTKIKKEDYLAHGQFPIIDQGQTSVAGYSNKSKGLFCDVPAVIFGDHTRIIKYIDIPFFLGADGVKVLKTKNSNIDYKYLYYCFAKNEVPNTGYNRHFKWLKEILIPLPPLDVQREIAATLDEVSDMLKLRKEQLAQLDLLVKSQFIEMFGDPNFELVELIDLIIDGAGLSYGIVQPGDDGTGEMGVLRPVDFTDGKIIIDNIKYIDRTIGNSFKKTVLTGDELLITVRGTTGLTALTDERFAGMNVTRGIAVIRYNKELINPIYLNAYLNTDESQQYIAEHTRGATLQQINLSDLRIQKIKVPERRQQNQFADFVQQVDKSKLEIQQAIDETQTLFDSLMQEYFE